MVLSKMENDKILEPKLKTQVSDNSYFLGHICTQRYLFKKLMAEAWGFEE